MVCRLAASGVLRRDFIMRCRTNAKAPGPSRMQQAVDALGRFAALRAPEVSAFRSGVDGD